LVLTAVLEFVQLGEKDHKFNGELAEEYMAANMKIPADRYNITTRSILGGHS